MFRPLLLEFPEDPLTARVDDACMLGFVLLVAPIFSDTPDSSSAGITLPEGTWFDLWTDERPGGGQAIVRVADRDEAVPGGCWQVRTGIREGRAGTARPSPGKGQRWANTAA